MADPFKFFLVTPLGFEEQALKELQNKYLQLFGEVVQAKAIHGGVEFEALIDKGCELNRYLKIPSKILLRVAEFKCRDFPKLFNKLKKIDIKKYFPKMDFTVQADSKKSRLQNEKRIIKTAQDAWKPKEGKFEVLIRFFNDECTVSINTSGELLYKRGYKTWVSKAPIRENLAAALVDLLVDDKDYTLLDPMCGSGSFLLEAQLFYEPVKREFDFDRFIQKNLKSLQGPRPILTLGFDIFETKNAEHNLKTLKNANYKISEHDLFKDAKPIEAPNLLVICNPPYGKLLKLPKPPEEYYQSLLHRLSLYKAKKIGCIFPKKYSKFQQLGYRLTKQVPFSNGGIDVCFNIYEAR